MYSIIKVIYGVPLTEAVIEHYEKIDEAYEDDFETLYSGSGEYPPGYIGIELGEISECGRDGFNRVKNDMIDGIKLTPSLKQLFEVDTKIDALSKELKEVLEPTGVYFIWYTS